jgi:hypothetical protein
VKGKKTWGVRLGKPAPKCGRGPIPPLFGEALAEILSALPPEPLWRIALRARGQRP